MQAQFYRFAVMMVSIKGENDQHEKKVHKKLDMLRKHVIQKIDLPTIRARSTGPPREPEMRSEGLLRESMQKFVVTGLLHTNPSRNYHNWSMDISQQL